MEYKEGVGDGFVDLCLVSNNTSKSKMADVEHFGVEGIRKTNKDELNVGRGDTTFVFGNVKSNKGILKKPSMGFTSVQFGPSLFYKAGSAWSSYNSGGKAMKYRSKSRQIWRIWACSTDHDQTPIVGSTELDLT